MSAIVFEDSDLIVLDKPAHLVVNNSDTTQDVETLQNQIIEKVDLKNSSEESEFVKRGGIVHRLDKETSGLIIVAKNEEAFEGLQAQFKERQVEKEYIALSHGEIRPQEGEIDVPVGRLPWNRKRFGILAGGRESKTSYKVIEERPYKSEVLSLVRLFPKTGRTHQIRVHLKYINRPIFSDFLYAGRKTSREDRKVLERVFLHASKISFNHPRTGERMTFQAKLPQELKKTLKMLEFKYGGDE